jgi:hypothetical protein
MAMVCRRPLLGGLGDRALAWLTRHSPYLGFLNLQWVHAHIIFEDFSVVPARKKGNSPRLIGPGGAATDLGFFPGGVHGDGPAFYDGAVCTGGFDDSRMREAVAWNDPPGQPHDTIGYNCQDWVDEVLARYEALGR